MASLSNDSLRLCNAALLVTVASLLGPVVTIYADTGPHAQHSNETGSEQESAVAMLHVLATPPAVALLSPQARFDHDEFLQYIRTHCTLYRSPLVIDGLIAGEGGPGDVPFRTIREGTRWAREHIRIDADGRSQVVEVTLTAASGKEAQRLLEMWNHVYLDRVVHAEFTQSAERLSRLKVAREKLVEAIANTGGHVPDVRDEDHQELREAIASRIIAARLSVLEKLEEQIALTEITLDGRMRVGIMLAPTAPGQGQPPKE